MELWLILIDFVRYLVVIPLNKNLLSSWIGYLHFGGL